LSNAIEALLLTSESSGGLAPTSEQLDVEAVVRDVVQRLRADESIGARPVEIHGGPITCLADRTYLSKILSVLVLNAVEHSELEVDVNIARRRRQVEITVEDHGEGVAPALVPRLFLPFSRQRPSLGGESSGLGLGLYTARQLAGAMGGSVRLARTAPGSGSVFAVKLPAA
jgi:signal transduction histidine kinase